MVVILGSLIARGDSCSSAGPGPQGVAQCQAGDAIIGLVPGYCAAIPNCIENQPYYDHSYSLELNSSLPAWLEVRPDAQGYQDVVASTPASAFRACAVREPTTSEQATVRVELTATRPATGDVLRQAATVTVRDKLPSVAITTQADRSQHTLADAANPALGFLAPERARITLVASTGNSEANDCADLEWTVDAANATIECDPARPSEAALRLDGPVGSQYHVKLTIREPSGLRTTSNELLFVIAAEDPERLVLTVEGPDVVPAYSMTEVSMKCERGLWNFVDCTSWLRPIASEWFASAAVLDAGVELVDSLENRSNTVGLRLNAQQSVVVWYRVLVMGEAAGREVSSAPRSIAAR